MQKMNKNSKIKNCKFDRFFYLILVLFKGVINMRERPQCCGECKYFFKKPSDRNYCSYLKITVKEKEPPCDAGWRKESDKNGDKE